MKFILIPVKDLSFANERLSSILTQEKRTALAYAMLEDVFDAVSQSKLADKKIIVTLDKKAKEMAIELGFDVIEEEKQEGESSSVDEAIQVCKHMGAKSVLVIPGDAPLITEQDLDFILDKEKDSPNVILVPSGDKLGTNAILRKPPDAIPSRFGHDSFRKHKEEADKKNIPYETYEIPNIALDIDEPKDFKYLKIHGLHTKAFKELVRLGLAEESIEKTA